MEITTQNYINPQLEEQSYVILNMVLAAAKRSEPKLNTTNNLSEKDEKSMISFGVRVLKGEITSELYADKFIFIAEKIIGSKISEKKYLKSKIQNYIKRDFLENKNNILELSLLKEKLERMSKKKVIIGENEKMLSFNEKIKTLFKENYC